MTDARLRSLERAAGDDPAAAAALVAERIRLQSFDGARDPRLDPRRGDEVERRATGARGKAVDRWVEWVWPRALMREMPYAAEGARPAGFTRAPNGITWLPIGTHVLALRERSDIYGTRGLWSAWVRLPNALGRGLPGPEVAQVILAEHPVLSDDLASGCQVESVTWSSGRPATSSPISAWRRWARGGRVVRVGS